MDIPAIDVGPFPNGHVARSNGVNEEEEEEEEEEESPQSFDAGAAVDVSCHLCAFVCICVRMCIAV